MSRSTTLEELAARIERTFRAPWSGAGGPFATMCAMSDGLRALGFSGELGKDGEPSDPLEIAAALRASQNKAEAHGE